jgi:site-specific DNA recombinase
MKKAIKYTRFSSDGQSSFSIERQDAIIDNWANYNKVHVIDTFKDEGYTARTFDRPDIKQLFSFIKKYHSTIDYLLVAELTRFSRDTGDAINMVKKIQSDYNIKIVSCGRSVIYDCTDSNSFFMMGLEFLLGNSENIKRQNDINGGIYTAKAIEGKWIQGGAAPFGYIKEGIGDKRKLVINPAHEAVIRFIYDSYLHNTPDYLILSDVKQMGFHLKGKSAIKDILKNPLYAAQQYVKPYKDLPGGLYPGKWPAIIDLITWNRVQDKLNYKPRTRVSVADEMPLRGVLHCHCGKLLTGAPSKNKVGNYFYYYKCQHSGHNTISAPIAHKQLHSALGYMSLPAHLVTAIKDKSEQILQERNQDNKKLLDTKQREYEQSQKQLRSLEEKWINEQINFETYNRWHSDLSQKINLLKTEIGKLNQDKDQLYMLLQNNLVKLTDMQHVYTSTGILQQQELLRQVFDNRLYYQEKVYRTPYIMPVFSHNSHILKEKQLLIVDQLNAIGAEAPSKWSPADLYRTPLFDFLAFIESLRVA